MVVPQKLLVRCGYEAYRNALQAKDPLLRKLFLRSISLIKLLAGKSNLAQYPRDCGICFKKFHVSSSRITVFPNWVETNRFHFSGGQTLTNRILFVGRLSKEKHLTLLFESLANTRIGLDLVGAGELHDELVQAAQTLEIDARFLGRLPNDQLPTLYQTHPVYVICSRYEGNPKTLLEAMSCGCAVIGTNVPGIREVIEHEKSGLLVEESVESLRSAILRLMDDEGLRIRLGKEARRQIMAENSWKRQSNKN